MGLTMDRPHREAIVDVIESWKREGGLVYEEMLRTAFRPLIEAEVGRYAGMGVRRDDIEKVAWDLLLRALRSFDPEKPSLVDYMQLELTKLRDKIEDLRTAAAQLRATPSHLKA